MSQEQSRPSRIPDFSSLEEEAEFWDTHDLSDFWDEFTPSTLQVSQELRDRVEARAREEEANGLVVLLDPESREELARRAGTRGIGSAALVRLWVEERLRAERAAS